ncbi:DNA-binding NtrC family response regulator [Phyllobacterium ifriqiyense]|uniref:DNA-binding NtrC family response regulator n=1 Tax=Phyllobacterium ifriqiyense TaxID=314238 RepID=A0ABU0S4A6_9HYPH|nr:hypothetical protein [Phyllobacterium ifriqiyense]MDQ0995574.1 DNA-binding NtrC family response regulator [Phyllobacterium ifriqiyense]
MNEDKSKLRRPITVLLVQPDVILNFFICEFLEEAGFKVFDVATTDEAMAHLQQHTEISAVIAEYAPGKTTDGSFIQRTAIQFPQMALVVTIDDGIIATDLPVDVMLLAKPFEPEMVEEILSYFLDKFQTGRERFSNLPMTASQERSS